jgi:hypothetical protein
MVVNVSIVDKVKDLLLSVSENIFVSGLGGGGVMIWGGIMGTLSHSRQLKCPKVYK